MTTNITVDVTPELIMAVYDTVDKEGVWALLDLLAQSEIANSKSPQSLPSRGELSILGKNIANSHIGSRGSMLLRQDASLLKRKCQTELRLATGAEAFSFSVVLLYESGKYDTSDESVRELYEAEYGDLLIKANSAKLAKLAKWFHSKNFSADAISGIVKRVTYANKHMATLDDDIINKLILGEIGVEETNMHRAIDLSAIKGIINKLIEAGKFKLPFEISKKLIDASVNMSDCTQSDVTELLDELFGEDLTSCPDYEEQIAYLTQWFNNGDTK